MIRTLRVISLILGPALLAASSFFWDAGRYGVIGGVLSALATPVWLYGLLGVWEHLQQRLPRLGTLGIIGLIIGVFGGIAFGLQGFFEAVFGVSGAESLAATADHPLAANLVLWLPGPAFPLTMVLLGVLLFHTRAVPRPLAAAIVLGGAAFPASRILRVDLIAHGADLLLLGASIALAVLVARGLPAEPLAD